MPCGALEGKEQIVSGHRVSIIVYLLLLLSNHTLHFSFFSFLTILDASHLLALYKLSLPLSSSDYERRLREREVQLKHLRMAQTSTATELKNLKNYLRTRGDNLVRLSRSVEKAGVHGSNESSLISAVQRAEPVMLRVSRKSLRAIPREKLEARIREKTSASREMVSVMRDSLQSDDENTIGKDETGQEEARGIAVEDSTVDSLIQTLETSGSFGGNTTKLIAQTGFVML